VAVPPDFGGPAGVWSPEELFVASVASCLMSTFLYFVERLGIRLRSYSSSAVGFMDKTPDGLRFKVIDVSIAVEVEDESDSRKATELKERLEKYCPISASLGFPVRLEVKAGLSAGRTSK
jgi:organic hydroperoxide reductase OsmC/OhrA